MHWILEKNIFNEVAFDTLVETLERFDIPYSLHNTYKGELAPAPEIACNVKWYSSKVCDQGTRSCETDHKNVICMGTYGVRHAAKVHGWYPGVFNLEPFNFQVQLAHWGDHMLNADAQVMPFRDVKPIAHAFIRPIEDSKVFDGKLYNWDEFYDWQQRILNRTGDYGSALNGDTLVQVCLPKRIYAEYRFWVVKGEIVTSSMYKRGGQVYYSSDVDQSYYDFVQARIAEWQPLETFVIDVCSIPGPAPERHDIKIVEINTLNSAGYYAGDMQKLVMALEAAYSK